MPTGTLSYVVGAQRKAFRAAKCASRGTGHVCDEIRLEENRDGGRRFRPRRCASLSSTTLCVPGSSRRCTGTSNSFCGERSTGHTRRGQHHSFQGQSTSRPHTIGIEVHRYQIRLYRVQALPSASWAWLASDMTCVDSACGNHTSIHSFRILSSFSFFRCRRFTPNVIQCRPQTAFGISLSPLSDISLFRPFLPCSGQTTHDFAPKLDRLRVRTIWALSRLAISILNARPDA
ncbi:hypothetical protein C8R45DRAFT_397242 [Mycena sanguinolenta]|nr:hypothetical protein C8R45DRAFT_397242 [Mycena sanguinolenta]